MAHELYVKDGVAAMAYVGDKPWHGLGQELTEDATIERWVQEAGMSYELLSAPATFYDGGTFREVPGRKVLYRSDDKTPLGVVGEGYNVVQPRNVVEFFRDLAEEHGFRLETAGVLFGGRKYWALARTPEKFLLGRQDEVRGHLLLATACDGSMSTVAKYVATRVVCNNTIQLALKEGGAKQVRVRHNAQFREDAVKTELGLFTEAFSEFAEAAELLNRVRVDSAAAMQFLVQLMGDPKKPLEEQHSNAENMRTIAAKFDKRSYIGSDMAQDSAWGLVNCVTEWVDHQRGKSQDRRLEYAWTGGGMDLKMRAFSLACGMFA